MEDINTLNSKLQSISKKLEEIQTNVLLQDEKVRKHNKDRALIFEEKKNLMDQLTEHKRALATENDEWENIMDVLKDNNFWIDKQREALTEQTEFKRTLKETLTNRSAFSSSEEERLRTQLEIEETKLAFLIEQIFELEESKNAPALTNTEHIHTVTPSAAGTQKPPLTPSRPFQVPTRATSNDRTSTYNGATTHSRAFSPPTAKAPSPASTRPPTEHNMNNYDPFADWADRGSSPRPLRSASPTQDPQLQEERTQAAETPSRRSLSADQQDNTQNSVESADIELDCTTAAQSQRQGQHQHQGGLENEVRVLRNTDSDVVELTTVRTTITEVRVQRGGPLADHTSSIASNYNEMTTPQPFERHYGAHSSEEVPWFKEHKRRRTVGPAGHYISAASAASAASTGGYTSTPYGGTNNSPYQPPLSPYPQQQSQHYPLNHPTAAPYSSVQQFPRSASHSPPQPLWPNRATSKSHSSFPYTNNNSPTYSHHTNNSNNYHTNNNNKYHQHQRSSPPLWPPTSEPTHSTSSTSTVGSATLSRSNSRTDILPSPLQRTSSSVIDLYYTSDSDNSDTGRGSEKHDKGRPNQSHVHRAPDLMPATTASSPRTSIRDPSAHIYDRVRSHSGQNTKSNKQGQDRQTQGQKLKDRFHTGLALLQQTAPALGDID